MKSLALLFRLKPHKDKSKKPDDSSVSTGNISSNSEGNVSAISSHDYGESTEADTQAEMNSICANILTTHFEDKVANNLDNKGIKPTKKKKRRKKGWREYTCPNTGNKYYSNGTVTTWDKPAEFDDENQEEPATLFASESGNWKRVTMISFA